MEEVKRNKARFWNPDPVKEKPKEKKKANTQKNPTLCWDCVKAIGGCSWSDDLIPVKDWLAKETKISDEQSFWVYDCPEFVRDAKNFGQERFVEGNWKGYEMSEPPTKAQLLYIDYIMTESKTKLVPFSGTTKGQAARWITKNKVYVLEEERRDKIKDLAYEW